MSETTATGTHANPTAGTEGPQATTAAATVAVVQPEDEATEPADAGSAAATAATDLTPGVLKTDERVPVQRCEMDDTRTQGQIRPLVAKIKRGLVTNPPAAVQRAAGGGGQRGYFSLPSPPLPFPLQRASFLRTCAV